MKKIKKELNSRQIAKRVEWKLSHLVINFKFVHEILSLIIKQPVKYCSTMCVSARATCFHLGYNEEFVNDLSDPELTYVLAHEAFHLALHHVTTRCGSINDQELWGYCHDLAVNELIQTITDICEEPKGKHAPVTVRALSQRPEFEDIKSLQSAEWYYDYFKRKQQKNGGGGKGKGQQEIYVNIDKDGNITITDKNGKVLAKLKNGKIDDHSKWKPDEVADTRISRKIDEIAKNDLWGNMEGTSKEVVLAAQVKKINWRNEVRTVVGNTVWRGLETTRKRPNRRMGFVYPGFKRLHVDKWLSARDTSASIDSECLSQFSGVINGILDYLPIDILDFDVDIQNGPKPFESPKAEHTVSGRGGTCFQPVIDKVDEMDYKGVIILTDGCAEAPTKPKHAQVIWLMPMGCTPPVDWGKVIYMNKYA